jgi:1-deoxy-D-xylulose-5-phosphate synthase
VGKMLAAAEEAAELLTARGVDATVWDVRVVKPLDPEMIADAARHPVVVTIEDGVRHGGAGSAIADAVGEVCCSGERPPRLRILGVPLAYLPHGKPDDILAELGLDGPGLAAEVARLLDSGPGASAGVAAGRAAAVSAVVEG